MNLTDAIAAKILDPTDSDLTLLDLPDIRPLLTPPAFASLCTSLDICAIHLRDLEICEDDDADCMN